MENENRMPVVIATPQVSFLEWVLWQCAAREENKRINREVDYQRQQDAGC